jgi:hypothetical protein
MEEFFKTVFFRMDAIRKTKVLDTQKCLAVGFLNVGATQAFLNRILPIPKNNANITDNIMWFPVNQNEKDATRYEILFQPDDPTLNNVIIIYKEVLTKQ